jgi:hypothetical protein
VIDGDKGQQFEDAAYPVLSHDGKVVAYQARCNGKSFIRVGHHEEPAFDKVSAGMAFSPDGKLVAYGAQQFGKNFLVTGTDPKPTQYFPEHVVFGTSGNVSYWTRCRQSCCAAVSVGIYART